MVTMHGNQPLILNMDLFLPQTLWALRARQVLGLRAIGLRTSLNVLYSLHINSSFSGNNLGKPYLQRDLQIKKTEINFS